MALGMQFVLLVCFFKIARLAGEVNVIEKGVFAVHRRQGDARESELAKIGVEIASDERPDLGQLGIDAQRCAVALGPGPGVVTEFMGEVAAGWSPIAVVVELKADLT